jgi:hypothetical protein
MFSFIPHGTLGFGLNMKDSGIMVLPRFGSFGATCFTNPRDNSVRSNLDLSITRI